MYRNPILRGSINAEIPKLPDLIPFPPRPRFPGPPEYTAQFLREFQNVRLIRSLRSGCYVIKLTFGGKPFSVYDGTLRVESKTGSLMASGDLYERKLFYVRVRDYKHKELAVRRPFMVDFHYVPPRIPIFDRSQYRYYIRVTNIVGFALSGESVDLEFEMHRFDSASKTWTLEGTYTVEMSWTTAPLGFPSSDDYLEGDVKNTSGVTVARLTMGWVSDYLRRAIVEIDRVSESEVPLDNGEGTDWRTIFDQVGWDVDVVESNNNVTEPNTEGLWNASEVHQTMLDWRDSSDLDTAWRYYLLCVRHLEGSGYGRGYMFDSGGTDSNNVPREGAVIASHWLFTNDPYWSDSHPWGPCATLRFGQCARAYFRTGVHEISHATLLFHHSPAIGDHIMTTTDVIAEDAAAAGVQFPDNIEWSFAPEDEKLLRHLPDVALRPGGEIKFEEASATTTSPAYSGIPMSDETIVQPTGIELRVSPLLVSIPLGAPVRVSLSLANAGTEEFLVPADISMKSGNLTGKVIDPSGTERTFSTIIRMLDTEQQQILKPSQSVDESVTLLRGPQGALFPLPGLHRVVITLTWDGNDCRLQISGETNVMVTSATDDKHAEAALKVLATPDTLLALVIGGDHIKDGIEAVNVALKNPILREHYAYIEAKRLAQPFGKRKANLAAAAKLITNKTIMSPAEIAKASKIVKTAGTGSDAGRKIAAILKDKVRKIAVNEATRKMVEAL